MLFVDDRDGSKDVYKSLDRAKLPVDLVRLEAGDIYFVGRGVNGAPLNIGIEHKTISDAVGSLKSGRLQGHQLMMMRAAEPGEKPAFDHCWLLLEGDLIYDNKGMLQRRTAGGRHKPIGMTVDEFYKRLTVLHLCGGLNWVLCPLRRDTVHWITAFYHTLTDKDLDKHKSHLAIYQAPTLVPLSQFRSTMATLPGVSGKTSIAAERKFRNHEGKPSIRRAINASVTEWATLETEDKGKTRKFGTSKAHKVMEAIG